MTSTTANGKANGVRSTTNINPEDEETLKESAIGLIRSDAFVVDWYGPDDPGHPQNLPRWRKWAITMSMALHVLSTTFASSVMSAATRPTAAEFGVSIEVTVLATSLFMVGFGVGPPIFGPLSERYGRKNPLFVGYLLFILLQIPVALARNVPTILVFRFFQGVAGSAPSSIIGGALADIWSPRERGFAVPCVAAFLMIGPVLGPIIGSIIAQSPLGWRWIEYVTAIMSLAIAAVTFPAMTEGYSPVLLARRAKRLRHMTRNWALRAKFEETETNLKDLADRYLQRPAKMLVLEPILLLISIYMSFVFGLTYLFFLAYPMSFALERGWHPTQAGLPLLSILLGVIGGGALIAFTTRTRLAPNPQEGRPQETRLLLMMLGAILLPVGMFWFAWTSSPKLNPWPQIVAGIPIGFGIILINMQGLNYIIDCYLINANSAIAANTCLRSLFAAGFPLFA
ncbi:MAG: Cercosporin MFS transporter ctb4 [Bogoriella megaspora]|nr:MAG: Cercosporin MFS transporter ctb4 [Bogoriella megaspora]